MKKIFLIIILSLLLGCFNNKNNETLNGIYYNIGKIITYFEFDENGNIITSIYNEERDFQCKYIGVYAIIDEILIITIQKFTKLSRKAHFFKGGM